jgi:DNA-binding response OmpR family regulator
MAEKTEQKKKVLVIEDDESVARVYAIKLQQLGVDVVMAGDGEAGFAKLKEEKPSVVLLDLMLPIKDGFWVLEERGKVPALKKVPVIVLSNLGQETDKERATSLGATEYLVKANISIKDLLDKIKTYL